MKVICFSVPFLSVGLTAASAAAVLTDNLYVTDSPSVVSVSSSNNIMMGFMSSISSVGGVNVSIGIFNETYGQINFTHGEGNIVTGLGGFTTGEGNINAGNYGVVFGNYSQTGMGSRNALAGGQGTIANATAAVSLGRATTANTYASMVVGQYNAPLPGETDPAAKTSWRGTDPLFVVGNGASAGAKSNALVITKDGTVTINRIPPKGGISMGFYTSP